MKAAEGRIHTPARRSERRREASAMGELVAVLAASHAPNLLLELGKEWTDFMDLHYSMMPGGDAQRPTPEAAQRFAADVHRTFGLQREVLQAARPDALIVVANDQFVNFFYD